MTRRPALLLTALAVGALAACGGGDEEEPAAAGVAASGPPDAQVVRVLGTSGLEFEPAVVEARTGSLTITLANDGGPPHDLVPDDKDLPAIGAVAAGQEKSATYRFTSAGTYDFVCSFHPGMDGRVVVR